MGFNEWEFSNVEDAYYEISYNHSVELKQYIRNYRKKFKRVCNIAKI